MSPVVVDASVAVKWFVEDVLSAEAAAAIWRYDFFAPGLIFAEAANGLWKYARRGDMAAEDCRDALVRLTRQVRATPDEDLVAEAMVLSVTLDHPVDDCLYLALTRRLGYPLLTADRRLLALARERMGLTAIGLDEIEV